MDRSFSACLTRRVEGLLNAVTQARDLIASIAEIPFARPGREALKNEIILPLSKGP
jgi:hypothetical protein